MANIGHFKPTRSGYDGSILTLTLCASVRFVRNRKKKKDTSPDYFIKTADSDLGVAWSAQTNGDDPKSYLKCLLDDPSFAGPVHAALFVNDNGADLVWSRRTEASDAA